VSQPDEIAEVLLRQGRYFLVVRGVYVAMETDSCRDPDIEGRTWTPEALRQAAALINSGRWASAAARWVDKASRDR